MHPTRYVHIRSTTYAVLESLESPYVPSRMTISLNREWYAMVVWGDRHVNNRLFYLRLPLLVLKRINKEVTTPRPIKDWDLQLLNYLMYVRLSH